MPFCKKCGRGIDRDSRFCEYCGASQVPAKAWIDPTLLVIVLIDIVVLTVLGLESRWLTGHILAIVGIVANVAVFGIDLVHRHAQRLDADIKKRN